MTTRGKQDVPGDDAAADADPDGDAGGGAAEPSATRSADHAEAAAEKQELGWIGLRIETLRGHLTKKPDPLTSVVFVLPIFLGYSLGVLGIDRRVGVDFLSRLALEQLLGRSTLAYVLVHLGVAAALGGVVWILRKKGKIEAAKFVPMLVESILWALVAGALVHLALARLLPAAPVAPAVAARAAAQDPGALARCVLALGSGFYEEVVFRAAVVGSLAWALPKYLSLPASLTSVIAIGISVLLFVVYRWLVDAETDHGLRAVLGDLVLGLLLGVAFRFRGFATAVYAHSLFGLLTVVFGAR